MSIFKKFFFIVFVLSLISFIYFGLVSPGDRAISYCDKFPHKADSEYCQNEVFTFSECGLLEFKHLFINLNNIYEENLCLLTPSVIIFEVSLLLMLVGIWGIIYYSENYSHRTKMFVSIAIFLAITFFTIYFWFLELLIDTLIYWAFK